MKIILTYNSGNTRTKLDADVEAFEADVKENVYNGLASYSIQSNGGMEIRNVIVPPPIRLPEPETPAPIPQKRNKGWFECWNDAYNESYARGMAKRRASASPSPEEQAINRLNANVRFGIGMNIIDRGHPVLGFVYGLGLFGR